MGWFKKRVLKIMQAELKNRELDIRRELEKDIDRRMEDKEFTHAEDYKFLAERVNALEEEVFDCSDDDKDFPDEDEEDK